MAVWSEMCMLVRWVFRQSEPPPPPGTGQRHQVAEQAEAQRRLLDQAERLRRTQRYCEHPGNGTRGHG